MKTPIRLLGLTLALLPFRLDSTPLQPPAAAGPIGLEQTVPVRFPPDLVDCGIRAGWADIGIDIDEQGRLADHLLIDCSHRDFGAAALLALQQWRYRPAVAGGRPISTITILHFEFQHECQGVRVVTFTALSYGAHLLAGFDRVQPGFYRLEELDRIPTPVRLVNPAYSTDDAARQAGKKVKVTFYIDATGAVRLPSLDYADNEEVARRAFEAVRQWRFEPPRHAGHPVVTRASQLFEFAPRPQ